MLPGNTHPQLQFMVEQGGHQAGAGTQLDGRMLPGLEKARLRRTGYSLLVEVSPPSLLPPGGGGAHH